MPDPRNVDFLRQHARVDQRVSNIETGVHPVKADVPYEDLPGDDPGTDEVGIQFVADNVGNWLRIHTTDDTVEGYGTYIRSDDPATAALGVHADTGVGLEASGSTFGLKATANAFGGGTALGAATPISGDAIHAYTGNGIGINVIANNGTSLNVDCGFTATAVRVSIDGGEVFRIDSAGTHINGSLYLNGVPLVP